jgi:hypothetical protein
MYQTYNFEKIKASLIEPENRHLHATLASVRFANVNYVKSKLLPDDFFILNISRQKG